jgi:hypothetical protein
MAMAPATRALIARALRQREAVGRAGVAAADQVRAAREAAETQLAEDMVRERDYTAGRRDEAALFGALDAAWREAAAMRREEARRETQRAAAACDAARDVLAETARTTKGFDLLMERQDAERARREARRDTLPQLMVLPRGG